MTCWAYGEHAPVTRTTCALMTARWVKTVALDMIESVEGSGGDKSK